MTTTALLEVDGLHAGYGRAEVLSGISLSAKAGSVVAVVEIEEHTSELQSP